MTQCLARATGEGQLLHAGGDTFQFWLLMTGLQTGIRCVLGTDQQRGTFVVRPCLGFGPQFFSGLGRYRATCSGSVAIEKNETTGARHARAETTAKHLPSGFSPQSVLRALNSQPVSQTGWTSSRRDMTSWQAFTATNCFLPVETLLHSLFTLSLGARCRADTARAKLTLSVGSTARILAAYDAGSCARLHYTHELPCMWVGARCTLVGSASCSHAPGLILQSAGRHLRQ